MSNSGRDSFWHFVMLNSVQHDDKRRPDGAQHLISRQCTFVMPNPGLTCFKSGLRRDLSTPLVTLNLFQGLNAVGIRC